MIGGLTSSVMQGRASICSRRRQAGPRPVLMQRMQAAHVAFQSSEMRGRLSICSRRRQAGRRPELMQRMQAARVAFQSSYVRGRPSICTHRHEGGKRQTAKTVAISLKCSIVCRTQHIFHGFRPQHAVSAALGCSNCEVEMAVFQVDCGGCLLRTGAV